MKHAQETQAIESSVQHRLEEHTKEKAAKKKTMDIEAFVGIDADAKLFAGWQHAEGRMDWKDEDKDIAMHVYMNPSKLPEDWKKLFFGKKRVPAKRFHKVAFAQVEQIAKHITNLGHLHPGDSPKKTMQKLKQKMKSTKASEMNIRQRLEHAKENADVFPNDTVQILVGIEHTDYGTELVAGFGNYHESTKWMKRNADLVFHFAAADSALPDYWWRKFFGMRNPQPEKLYNIGVSHVREMMKYMNEDKKIQYKGQTSPKRKLAMIQSEIMADDVEYDMEMSNQTSKMTLRQRLMQLDDENSQESAARDTVTKVPSMTTKKMKEVLPDLKLSYINLMTLLSLIDSGRNAPEELPKGFGKKELKIAVNEARMIWLWLQSNSIRLGFNFKEYT